jgi:hypothetical protein
MSSQGEQTYEEHERVNGLGTTTGIYEDVPADAEGFKARCDPS